MGVGTNLFPMQLEQRAKLASFVSADEMEHIEAFPTVVRLMTGLLNRLEAMSDDELRDIREFECCRVLGPRMNEQMRSDNAPVRLSGDQFWVQLNYHLIHSMDFLPVDDWEANALQLYNFARLHQTLSRAGKLYCRMNFDSEKWVAAAKQKRAEAFKKAGLKVPPPSGPSDLYSDRIGHSLDYKLSMVKRARL